MSWNSVSLCAPSGDNNRKLVKTLLEQIEYLKKELTHKNTIISCLLKWKTIINQKPKSSDNSNSDNVIENSSQNQNHVAYGIGFARNNNVNDVSINIAEDCTNVSIPKHRMLELSHTEVKMKK